MSKRDLGLLGTTRDEENLLNAIGRAYENLHEALAAGAVVRRKITNQWLYARSPTSLEIGLEAVEGEAIRRIRPWLLGATPYLRGPIARVSARPRVTENAVELLLRQLARDRRLGVLGMLSSSYEPYLCLYAPDDADEITHQLSALMDALRRRGYVRSADLPAPERPREANGWRLLILKHGEFLGLGRLDDGVLRSWEALVAT